MTKSLDRFTSSHSLDEKRKMSVSRKNEMFFVFFFKCNGLPRHIPVYLPLSRFTGVLIMHFYTFL